MSDCDPDNERGNDGAEGDPPGGEATAPSDQRVGVMVELRLPTGEEPSAVVRAAALDAAGFERDASFEPVPMSSPPAGARGAAQGGTVLVRGTVPESRLAELEARDGVVKAWADTPVEPFGGDPE